MKKVEKRMLKSAFAVLKEFDILAKDDSYVGVVMWDNEEGFDISIYDDNESKIFSLTDGQIRAIKYLTKKLYKWDGE